jgi:membrane-associated phospholipid phosphatase
MDIHLWKSFLISNFAVVLVSYVIYLVYPTYVHRPRLPDRHSWQIELVRIIYCLDRPYNAFPSGHAYNTLLIALFWCRWPWIGMTVIILLSTLFTRQPNLPDPIGGVALAALGYRFSLWRGSWDAKGHDKLPPCETDHRHKMGQSAD